MKILIFLFSHIPGKNNLLLQKHHKIILGIDPGSIIMGYSVIAVKNDIITLKEIDVLKLPTKVDNYGRLYLIHQKVTELVRLHKPHEMAIEAPFFGKNVQSMLKLGRAQGVAIAAAMNHAVPVTEYSPRRIKQSITGNGNADKEQVWKMLQTIIGIEEKPKYFDATDALSVAVCHFFSEGLLIPKAAGPKKKGSASSWEQFASENPGRVG
jgi:crossover junction endodeoxyribonuclease RuvC